MAASEMAASGVWDFKFALARFLLTHENRFTYSPPGK
jgi:hypothetical protein